MGYTHYWYKPAELPKDKFKGFIADFKKVVKSNETLSKQVDIETKTQDLLVFNGIGNQAYETFVFDRIQPLRPNEHKSLEYFNFCKTARMEYDMAVCCALIIAKKHFKTKITINSDGANEPEMWIDSKRMCQRTLGYGIKFDFSNGSGVFRRSQNPRTDFEE